MKYSVLVIDAEKRTYQRRGVISIEFQEAIPTIIIRKQDGSAELLGVAYPLEINIQNTEAKEA